MNWKFWIVVVGIMFLCGCMSSEKKEEVVPLTGQQQLTKALTGTGKMVNLGILGIVIGALAFANGTKWGMMVAMGGGLLMSLSLMVTRYGNFIAILVLIASIGALVYSLFVEKGMFVLKRNGT